MKRALLRSAEAVAWREILRCAQDDKPQLAIRDKVENRGSWREILRCAQDDKPQAVILSAAKDPRSVSLR